MTEKRVLIAALLSSLFLAWYVQTFLKSPHSARARLGQSVSAPAAPTLKAEEGLAWSVPPADEPIIFLESKALQVQIGRDTSAVRRVVLKEFLDKETQRPLELATPLPLMQLRHNGKNIPFQRQEADSTENCNISYRIDQDNPILNMQLQLGNSCKISSLELLNSWTKADTLANRYNQLEIILLKKITGNKKLYERHRSYQKNWMNVSRGTFLASLTERYFCQSIKPVNVSLAPKRFPASEGVAAIISEIEPVDGATTLELNVYFGPRDYFRMKNAGFESAFPIGTLGQIGLILLTILGWIASLVKNYGVAIILFSGLITSSMAPITLTGFKSMRKMQELKPKVDRLMNQYKDDPKRANQEVFALYREHRVSPMSGCLPMMLQIPIFMAMFNAISHFIELRGKSFLWIRDLSLPDRLAHLPFSMPILGPDLNLLPIIMAGAMYLQTKMSQGTVTVDKSNPSSAMFSSPLMSVMFGVMFYHFPAGLVLYWLTNSLVSLAWYRLSQ